jgi:hypothetical protein
MFARYFIEVPLPADQVERALLDSPAEWLSAIAGAAQERGDGLLVEVGVRPWRPASGAASPSASASRSASPP